MPRQHVWEQPSEAGAGADGPVLGALMSVMQPTREQGLASDLSLEGIQIAEGESVYVVDSF